MKCDKCGIENNTVRSVTINERDINICSDCINKIGDIHSIGFRSVSDHISDAAIEKTYVYLASRIFRKRRQNQNRIQAEQQKYVS